ncbi:MAG: hypothetical protein WCI27_10220 [Candidatus Omnitrophota bacterium]
MNACVVTGNAHYLVTGNFKHFSGLNIRGFHSLSPLAEAYAYSAKEDEAVAADWAGTLKDGVWVA